MRFDVVDWVHKMIADTARALRDRFPQPQRPLSKSLDDLDREIRKAGLADSVDPSRSDDGRLYIDALASNEELRLIIALYLRGWTWQEIETKLKRTRSGARSGT